MIVCELCRKVELLGYRVIGRWKFKLVNLNLMIFEYSLICQIENLAKVSCYMVDTCNSITHDNVQVTYFNSQDVSL